MISKNHDACPTQRKCSTTIDYKRGRKPNNNIKLMEMDFMQMLEKDCCPCKSALDGTKNYYGGWTAALASQPYNL